MANLRHQSSARIYTVEPYIWQGAHDKSKRKIVFLYKRNQKVWMNFYDSFIFIYVIVLE